VTSQHGAARHGTPITRVCMPTSSVGARETRSSAVISRQAILVVLTHHEASQPRGRPTQQRLHCRHDRPHPPHSSNRSIDRPTVDSAKIPRHNPFTAVGVHPKKKEKKREKTCLLPLFQEGDRLSLPGG